MEDFHMRVIHARRDIPVNGAYVVADLVLPDLFEFHPPALEGRVVSTGKEIGDEGVSDSFRKGGWSSKYPTRSLEEWEKMLAQWETRVMSPAGLGGGQRKRNKKKTGARPEKAEAKKE